MLLVWSESRTREALDQVIAIRGERSRNVLAIVGMVPSNDAVAYTHLARYVVPVAIMTVLNREAPTIVGGFITIDGTKLDNSLAADIGDAAAEAARGRIVRDGAVGEGECAARVVDAAAPSAGGRIARDGAVGEGERAADIEDAAAEARGRIVRDGTVGEGECAAIGNAAAEARG